MTKPAPARLIGYFAKSAPVCVILRRGPSRYTLMIKWNTDTDVFEVGQWTKGRIEHFSMDKTGGFIALGIRGRSNRYGVEEFRYDSYSVVCRLPYFSALMFREGDFLSFRFTKDGRLYAGNVEWEKRSKGKPPFGMATDLEWMFRDFDERRALDARMKPAKGTDQSGREILFDSGKIFAIENGEPRLLFDTNPLTYTPVEPPSWALTWNEIPGDHT